MKTKSWLNKCIVCALFLSGIGNLTHVLANDSEQMGLEVATRSDLTDHGFKDSEVELTMILRNAAGQESRRSLRVNTLEVADADLGDKSLVIFYSPKDIEGTALLSHSKILDPDDQWLFLPALKRVKRISSANKSGAFAGSEFAFEDFTSLELNKYTYNFLREEVSEDPGSSYDVVERFPRYSKSGYTRQVVWFDRTDYQIRKLEYYDRRNELLKTLTLSDYRSYDGYWRAHTLKMVNHQTKKSTDLIYDEYRLNIGLTDQSFSKGKLVNLR